MFSVLSAFYSTLTSIDTYNCYFRESKCFKELKMDLNTFVKFERFKLCSIKRMLELFAIRRHKQVEVT